MTPVLAKNELTNIDPKPREGPVTPRKGIFLFKVMTPVLFYFLLNMVTP